MVEAMKDFRNEVNKMVTVYGTSRFRLVLGCIVAWLTFPITLVDLILVNREYEKILYEYDDDYMVACAASCYLSNLLCYKIFGFVTGMDLYNYILDTLLSNRSW